MHTDGYQHRRHNKNLLMAHIILVTKYRKKLFYGELDADIKQYLFDACAAHHWYIRKMESDKDHIHFLLQYNPADSITHIVSVIKQETTYRIWKKHERTLRKCYWKKKAFWSGGYFAASIGQISQATVEHYIETQG